jgi:glycosyltransferase involved in cell wall biosynthesis
LTVRSQKAVMLSAGQPSLNPRLVKEADSLCNAGYDVTVLYCYWNQWGADFDKQLIPTKKWKAIQIGGDPQQTPLVYFFTKALFRFALFVCAVTKGKMLADVAIARPAYLLNREAKKHKGDIFIAHHLGALPAVITASKANNKPCGFDAEDFHRNETSGDINNADVVLKTTIENKYFPQVTYLTASSQQIAAAYEQIFIGLKPAVLLNAFPKSDCKVIDRDGPLKLFWFSQTIGPNRGLDDVVNALQTLNKEYFELHLLGDQLSCNTDFINEILNSGIMVKLHAPIPSDQIITFANQFDIGLALENKAPINRDICLTNKIFTYMQAGLAIIASDTAAQRDFIAKNPTAGNTYPAGHPNAMAAILLDYYNNRPLLTAVKTESLRLGHAQYSWEAESLKFLELVKHTLQ